MINEQLFHAIVKDKATFKIVTKTRNESFFIEKWIQHHLAIVPGSRLIIFDNLSDEKVVHDVYKKYAERILLVKFEGYMDCIHMAHHSLWLYQALAASSDFFTIIDSDEYLYLYDGHRLVHDASIGTFLRANTDCNFFAPCWLENLDQNANTFHYNPDNMFYYNYGKVILNSRLTEVYEKAVAANEYTVLHHTCQLPAGMACGKSKTRFVLAHLKNLNRYQRIKANMTKLVSLGKVRHPMDFASLLKLDPEEIKEANSRRYVNETKNLVEKLRDTNTDRSAHSGSGFVTINDDLSLKFTPEELKENFRTAMNSDYFDLIHFSPDTADINSFATIAACQNKAADTKA